MIDINPEHVVTVRCSNNVAKAALRQRRRPQVLITAHGVWCSGSTLGTLERCQRPLPMSPSQLMLILDEPSAGGEGAVIWNVISTRTRSRNTCNVKTMIPGPPRAGPRPMEVRLIESPHCGSPTHFLFKGDAGGGLSLHLNMGEGMCVGCVGLQHILIRGNVDGQSTQSSTFTAQRAATDSQRHRPNRRTGQSGHQALLARRRIAPSHMIRL